MPGRSRRGVRIAVAIALALPAFLGSLGSSSAAPTKQEVEAAKAELDQINQQLSLLVERYNQAAEALRSSQAKLAEARTQVQRFQAEAEAARAALSARARAAYIGAGSQMDALLGATSFTDFSDRLEFMGQIAASDNDLANRADVAAQQARWAADRFAEAVAEEQKQREAMQSKVDAIKKAAAEQAALYRSKDQAYQAALAAEKAAEQAAEDAQNGGGGGGGGDGGYIPPPPPPNTSAAQTAIYYAKSVVGTTYVWGSADPSVGFDCSGLTMWAWAHAGVSLPHSSAMQYAVLPHVGRDLLAPGDLIFFYNPISHVSMYLGGNMMVDASHPGPGGEVQIRSVFWDNFTGAARPG